MKFRNTFAIAVLFLALAGYLYFVEKPRHEQEAEQKKLLRFQPDDVSQVTLTYPDKQIVVKKTGAGWQLHKPIDARADQTAVQNLVRAVGDAEVRRTLEADAKPLEVYGLDKPETIVTLTLSNGTALPSIRVGKAAPVGFSAYVQLEGSTDVRIVGSVFQTGMKREVKDLRDKTVLDFQDADVKTIEVTTPDSTIELARESEGWKIEKPRSLKADTTEVNAFLSSLRGTRAEDFVDEPGALADYGLDHPREKVAVLVGKEMARKELWIGAEKAKDSKNVLYVKRGDADTVFAVGTWTWTSLNKNLAAFRDKTVLPFELSNLATVEVSRREGEGYRLVKEAAAAGSATPAPTPAPQAWKVDGAKGSKNQEIDQLVGDLHGLKGYEIAAENPADLSPYGLAAPDLTFSLIDASGKPLGRLLASQSGSGPDANAYAMAEGGDVVYRLRGYLYSHLDKKKEDFVETPPTPAPAPTAK
ncbi:MAG TPA: DUF4340 domain-containing protein [Candidatus Binatia bacterium]|nr:DUF4340 domain-containing protein [Candidatus Binatia bacterium]